MARNEEKNFARLNRLILQEKREAHLKKHPRRPKLDTLTNAAQVRNWLPSIEKDISFNLKQSQVPCYTEAKVQEYRSEVDRLKREHTAFLRKLKNFDSDCQTNRWADRPYKRSLSAQATNVDNNNDAILSHLQHDDETATCAFNKANVEDDTDNRNCPLSAVSCTDSQSSRQDDINTNSETDEPEKKQLKLSNLPRISLPILNSECIKKEKCSSGMTDTRTELVKSNNEPLNFRQGWLDNQKKLLSSNLLGLSYDLSDNSDSESNS